MSSTFASMVQDVAAIMIIAPRVDAPDSGRQLGETSNPKKMQISTYKLASPRV